MPYGASRCLLAAALASLFAGAAAADEAIKIGMLKSTANGPNYLAREQGYFAAEGLSAEFVYFEAGQPIAVATVSGDIDIGSGALTAGLFTLAGQGALRIIAGTTREFPGFQIGAIAASNQASAAGLGSLKDIGGRSFALSTVGSPGHYSLGRLAEKYAVDLKTIRVLPLQSNPNVTSAVTGGQADFGIIQVSFAMTALQRGDVKLLGWVGDEVQQQLSTIFVATKTATGRRDMVERYLRAYRKGAREYHDAFADAGDKRRDGPAAPAVLAIIAKYVPQPEDQLRLGISYVDGDARLDIRDVNRQIDWYKAQGMVKGDVDRDALIDTRFVKPLPER